MDKRLRELAWELVNASEIFERTLSQWNTLARTQLFTATKAMKEALSSTSEPPTHVTFDKPIIGSDGMVQTGWQSAAPSEPQASEPPKPEYQDATIYFDEVPEQGSNRAMIYIWPKPQPESVSAQGNKQVFMCGCISYNTALVPRCPIHKQASEPPASEGQT